MYRYEAQVRSMLKVITTSGREAMCLCPFHDNKHSPAMQVNLETGLWVCFVCVNEKTGKNLGGNMDMLSDRLGLRFSEPEHSVVELRDYTEQIDRMEEPPEPRKVYSESTLSRYLAMPTMYWQSRGITDRAVVEWQLGYDPIHDVAIIPMRDWRGQLLGVTQRYLSGPVKYMYPAGFPRRHELYGSWKFSGGAVALVEGALDVVYCWQAGVPALAQYGSSVTEEQARLMLRLGVTQVVLMMDNDSAGRKATAKAVERLWGMPVHIAVYPSAAKDPGELSDEQVQDMFRSAQGRLLTDTPESVLS